MTGSHERPIPFRWEIFPERERVRVAPEGELDAAVVDELAAAIDELRQAGFSSLVLDLRALTFIDSSGLRLVFALAAAASEDGLTLQLLPGPPEVQRIFELTGTLEQLPFGDSPR
jgi:anti-sigma B factor antagonist